MVVTNWLVVRISMRLVQMDTSGDPLLEALGLSQANELFELEARIAFVTSHTGTLLFANDQGRTFLDLGFFIHEQDGQIAGASPACQQALETGLGAPNPIQILMASADTSAFALCDICPSAEARLWRVRRIGADASREAPRLAVGFEQAFNLTPSEASLCRHLIKPGRETEIADALRLSLETVRTHRKRIYMKLGVTERAELIRLAWRLSDGF